MKRQQLILLLSTTGQPDDDVVVVTGDGEAMQVATPLTVHVVSSTDEGLSQKERELSERFMRDTELIVISAQPEKGKP